LPLSGVDVFALIQYTFHFHFVFNPEAISSGSNAWAIAPSRSCQRRPLLLANPHLPWGDLYTFYEAHLVLADGSLDIYGASLVGLPFIAIGFNRHLGWTHTVNTQDGADLYALVPTDGGYKWDNEAGVLPFQIKEHTLRVKQPSGDLREEQVVVRSSVHGPVIVETESAPIALRMVGLDQPFMFEQYWDMMRAVDLRDFEAAIRHLQIPTFMILYADRDGHIMSLFGGRTPVRPPGPWNWQGIVPGDTSQALWTETLGYDALPRVVDPPTGWVQNANDPPWTTTLPPALDPTRFPAYLAPHFMDFRAQRSAQILSEFDRISLDELICLKHSTRLELADRILDDLLAAARASGSEVARAGADALLAWDRTTDADSRAALVFDFWVKEMPWQNVVFASSDVFAIPWDERHPITTPRGLRDPAVAVAALERAATRILTQYGSLAAAAGPPPGPAIDPRWLPLYLPWGAIHRLRRDSLDLPANGAHDRLGLMRVFEYVPSPVGGVPIYQVVQGDSFIFAAELGEPRRARVLLSYGNSSQPGSPHRTDQLPYVARKELRSARLERRDIEAHAVWRCVV
jgi:acyl-homoserine-lactone acylase